MAIQIKRYNGSTLVETLKTLSSENFSLTPDDRIEIIQTIDGIAISDGGRFAIGDRRNVDVVVDDSMFTKIKTIWGTRETVDVVFEDNTTVTNAIVLVKSIQYPDKLHPKYKKMNLEIFKSEVV